MALQTVFAYILLYTHVSVTAGPFRFSRGNRRSLPTELKPPLLPSLHAPYSVISTIIVKEKNDLTPDDLGSWNIHAGCMLVSEGDARDAPLWCGHAAWTASSLPLWNTLALLSDLLIVVVDSHRPVLEYIQQECLHSKIRQRVYAAGLPKGRLVILWNCPATPQELAAWKEQLDDSKKLSILSSDLLQLFFLSSGNSFQEALREAVWDSNSQTTNSISNLLNNDVEGFAPLFHRVFQSKGGTQDGHLLQKQVVGSLLPPRLMKQTELTAFDLIVRDTALDALLLLQSQQEEFWLDSESVPMNFSASVDPILETLSNDLNLVSSPQANRAIQGHVSEKVIQLYEQHARSLRDYYGTMFENLLDENLRKPAYWPECSETVKNAFEQRAKDSVPAMARQDGCFHYWNFDHDKAMDGLVQDMADITELKKQEDDDDHSLDEDSIKRRMPKWAEQLAARALMLGVNYIQGWLALQGIRRAALERERNLPKFPLF